MVLSNNAIKSRDTWKDLGVKLPQFDIDQVRENTRERPQWVHFGAGNIFRAFIANAHQKLLDRKKADTGIVAVESFDYEIIDRVYKPYDNLTLLVLMHANGDFDKTIIGSITEAIAADRNRTDDFNRLVEIFEKPSLQMASFTITEKGYSLTDADGNYIKAVQGILKKVPMILCIL